jgi:hypothetical protein
MGVNSLWTLTYKANVKDRSIVIKHLDTFRRRVREVLGDWRYIAVIERQDRGAYHVHLATHALPVRLAKGGVKVKSWDVMRAIWRRITGDLGGNFDESKARKRWGTRPTRQGAGSIARYLAKYVSKTFDDSAVNQHRFMRSLDVALPEVYRAEWDHRTRMADLIELAFAGLGDRIVTTFFDAESGCFFAESDDSVPPD